MSFENLKMQMEIKNNHLSYHFLIAYPGQTHRDFWTLFGVQIFLANNIRNN